MNPGIHGAAAAAKRRMEEEEEKMTQYNANDLEGWEFKIVRSPFGRFGNSEVLRQLINEEAQNGWEMVEKFDNSRIRFKRRVEKRALHSGGNIDPYRTSYGGGGALLPLIAIVVALLLAGVIFLVQAKNKGLDSHFEVLPIIFFAVFIVVVGMVIVMKRR